MFLYLAFFLFITSNNFNRAQAVHFEYNQNEIIAKHNDNDDLTTKQVTNTLNQVGSKITALKTFTFLNSDFNYHELKKIIQEQNVKSIEELLPLIPIEFRSSYTLVHASRSLHGSSFSNPRVIMFNWDANFIVTFNGSSEHRGFYDLEIMQFNDQDKKFEMKEISFSPGGKLPPKFKERPTSCFKCHGENLRPIWDSYRIWPGVYGALEDFVAPTPSEFDFIPQEQNEYNEFLSKKSSHPRYKYLPRVTFDFTDTINTYLSSGHTSKAQNLKKQQDELNDLFKHYPYTNSANGFPLRPNFRLTSGLYSLNVQRLHHMITTQSPYKEAFWKYPNLIQYIVDKMDARDLSTSFQSQFNKALEDYRIEKLNRYVALSNKRGANMEPFYKLSKLISQLEYLTRNDIANAYVLSRVIGFSFNELSLAFENYGFGIVSGDIDNVAELLRLVKEKRPVGAPVVKSVNRNEMLSELKLLSENPFESFHFDSTIAADDANLILNTCIACHAESHNYSIPYLPFDKPEQLKVMLNSNKKYPRGSLLAEITYRLNTDGVDAMPKNYRLNESQKKIMVKYFNELAESK